MAFESIYRKFWGPPTPTKEALEKEASEKETERIIEELRMPLEKIVSEFGEGIKNGEYSVIIGDDASGRIPALMMGDILKAIYVQNGFPPPLIRFIAGSTGLRHSKASSALNKKSAVSGQISRIHADVMDERSSQGKVMIVTEAISSGSSVDVLVEALKGKGWDRDIATVGIEPHYTTIEDLGRVWDARVVAGMTGTPDLYRVKDNPDPYNPEHGRALSGVHKDREQLFARRLTSAEADTPNLQARVNFARKTAKNIADQIAQRHMEASSRQRDETELSEVKQRLGLGEQDSGPTTPRPGTV